MYYTPFRLCKQKNRCDYATALFLNLFSLTLASLQGADGDIRL